MERPNQFLHRSPSEIVEKLKALSGISAPNADMSDAEIKAAMRVVAVNFPGSIPLDERLSTSRAGIELMLFLTLAVFPGYYQKQGLAQFN